MTSNTAQAQKARPEDFLCAVEGCMKKFKRKEHLVRHNRNHSTTSPLLCSSCGRGFARSDVLNRHLRQHGERLSSEVMRSIFIACDTCHDRKVKCPGGSPCKTCDLHGIECTRRRDVKRKRPTRSANQNDSAVVIHGEYQLSAPTQTSENLVTSAISNRNAAIGFSPDAQRRDLSIRKEASSSGVAAPSPTLPGEFVMASDSALGIDAPNAGKSGLTGIGGLRRRIPNEQTADPDSFDRLTIDRLLENFFTIWHPRWPVLHRQSFNWQTAPWDLVWIVCMIAAKLRSEQSPLDEALQREMAELLKGEISQTLEKSGSTEAVANLEEPEYLRKMQFYVLYVLFLLYFGTDMDVSNADRLLVNIFQLLHKSNVFHHSSLHEESPVGSLAQKSQESWRMLIITAFFADVYMSILCRRPPSSRYHDLHFPLPQDMWTSVARFDADVTWPMSRSWRTVSSAVQQCLDETERGIPLTNFFRLERHLVHCAIRSRLWQEKMLGSPSTMTARADQDHTSQSPRHNRDRRRFWQQTLSAWRAQGDKTFFKEHETASSLKGEPLRNAIESLNSSISHLSVIEMYADLQAIVRLAEHTNHPTQTLSDGEHDLIQLQLHIWSSSFHGRLSIWHASQILRHFTDKDEFSITVSDGYTIEPVAKQAYYFAGLILWAFCLDRKSCPQCIASLDFSQRTMHEIRPALELSFVYESDFYTRWIQKDGRFTLQGVVLCGCKRRNILNKVESAMMARGEHDAVVRSRSAVLLRLRDQIH